MTKRTWGGRFREDTNSLVKEFNSSLGFDKRLYREDIQGSIAHCRMLAKQEIISNEEASSIIGALEEIRQELESGIRPFEKDFEDIHSLVEYALIDKVGELGKKLHTGRSRNDQVALDLRLYVREATNSLIYQIKETQKALLDLAENHGEVIMPGYTHLQRAQPVLLAHHLMAYFEMFKRDKDRFLESLARTNVLPLGSAALTGSTFDLNREAVARELGFERISKNSMDAVSDRDFVLEFISTSALLMMHLSRLSEELVLWSSQEFDFITISDSFSTGSSIMPQKKNPDVPELIRGKTGRVYGHLMGMLTTMKGLPLSYNKDMQEDKEGLFDTVDTAEHCLKIMGALLRQISFNKEKLKAATTRGFLSATDLADYLVRKGLAFRRAHEVVGKIVVFASEQGKELYELSLDEMKGFTDLIGNDVYEWVDPNLSIDRRKVPGGTAREFVEKSMREAREELDN